MSRYDYRDPGTDPAYCDGLQAEDDIDVPDFDEQDPPIDPAERAAHTVITALSTLRAASAAATTFPEAARLVDLCAEIQTELYAVTSEASAKASALIGVR